MKRISKILSVVMIVAMLFSVAVIPTSAAGEYGFTYTFKDVDGNKIITSAKKGDVVRLYVNVNTGDRKINGFVNSFMYDASVFTVYKSKTAALTVANGNANTAIKAVGNFADTASKVLSESDYADIDDYVGNDEYYNWGKGSKTTNYKAGEPSSWDDAKKEQYNVFKIAYYLPTDSNVLFVETNGEFVEYAYFFMKVSEDTELTEAVVGIDAALQNGDANYFDVYEDQSYTFSAQAFNEGNETVAEDATYFGSTTLSFATAAEPSVAHEKFMGQMKDWTDASATKFNAGFVGKISNLELETNGKEVTNIESIVVEITRGTEKLTGNAYQLYAQADGSYLFRAVVKNAMIADNETVSYKYIVTLANGDQLTAEGTTSFGSIYSDAKTNYNKANS